MQDPMDVEQRYVVGSFGEESQVSDSVDRVGGSLKAWDLERDDGKIAVATVPLRHAQEIADLLEPNAQVLTDEGEARRIAEAAASGHGRPIEGRS